MRSGVFHVDRHVNDQLAGSVSAGHCWGIQRCLTVAGDIARFHVVLSCVGKKNRNSSPPSKALNSAPYYCQKRQSAERPLKDL
jgi:hypothetical protein